MTEPMTTPDARVPQVLKDLPQRIETFLNDWKFRNGQFAMRPEVAELIAQFVQSDALVGTLLDQLEHAEDRAATEKQERHEAFETIGVWERRALAAEATLATLRERMKARAEIASEELDDMRCQRDVALDEVAALRDTQTQQTQLLRDAVAFLRTGGLGLSDYKQLRDMLLAGMPHTEPQPAKDDLTPLLNVNEMGTGNIK